MIIFLIILFLLTGPIIIGYSVIVDSKLSRKEKWAEAKKVILFMGYAVILAALTQITPEQYEFWVITIGCAIPSFYISYILKKKKNEEIEPENEANSETPVGRSE